MMGVLVFAAFIMVPILLISGGSVVAPKIYPFLDGAAVIALIVDVLVLLPLLAFRRTRTASAAAIYFSSYIFGFVTWLQGFIVTLYFWGVIGVVVGLFIAGVGVVPIAMLA